MKSLTAFTAKKGNNALAAITTEITRQQADTTGLEDQFARLILCSERRDPIALAAAAEILDNILSTGTPTQTEWLGNQLVAAAARRIAAAVANMNLHRQGDPQ